MKTIFELTKITANSKARYPVRKTDTDELGLFSSLDKAQKQMFKEVEECQEYEQERLKDIAENEEYRKEEKRYGHNIVLAYRITELQLDMSRHWESIQSVRTYTADGQPNDECLLDAACKRQFKGRTPEQIRFRPGDIVEVIDERTAELCVVGHTQPTVEDYVSYRQRCWDECLKDCSRPSCLDKDTDYKEKHCIFQWDYSDDSYLMHSLGEGDTHFHPESPKVFRPTKPVPKALREKLKAKYEEMLRLYGANS